MALSTTDNKVTYAGNGATIEWPFTFPVLEEEHLKVILTNPNGAETTLSSDYVVDLTNKKVTYPGYISGQEPPIANQPEVLPTGWKITLLREVPLTQETVLENRWPFKEIEKTFDRATMKVQQLAEQIRRCLKHSVAADTDVSLELPHPVPLHSFRWDATGKKLETTLDPATVVEAATAEKEAAETARNGAETALENINSTIQSAISTATLTATEKATIATTKATTATEQAGIATTKATEAETSATNAAISEANALTHKTDAQRAADFAALASASPKGVYATVSALTTAFPSGNNNIYVVTTDGKWYYWSGSAWTAGGTYQSTSLADNGTLSTKVSAAAYGKPYILPGLVLPNYDTATKTLAFNSDATFKCMLFYKNTKYDIPVGTTVVDENTTSAVQLIFNTTTNTFSFIPHSTALAENELRVAVYKRLAGFYQWDFPCDITIDNKHMSTQNNEPSWDIVRKSNVTYAYIGYAFKPVILESQSNNCVYFNLPSDLATIAVRPGSGFAFVKTWPEIKALFPSNIVTKDGVEYLSIAEGYTLVANGLTLTLEIIPRDTLKPFIHYVILANSGGICAQGPAINWSQDYKTLLLGNRVTCLEDNSVLSLPSYVESDIISVQEKTSDLLDSNTISFIFITDTHADGSVYYPQIKNHLKAVVNMSKYGVADFICLGGDITSGSEANKATVKTKLSALSKILNDAKVPVFVLPGNHDDNSYYTTYDAVLAANVITNQEWYARMIKPFANGEIHDTQNLISSYYYKDLTDKKVRVVCLDTVDYPIITNGSGILTYNGQNFWGFGARQCTWLAAEALANIPNGYKVLVLSHMPTRATLNAYSQPVINGDIVEGILKACHGGTSYTGSNSNTDYGVSVTVDFTSQGARPILTYVHGHTHADLISKPAELGWNYISVPNSGSTAVSAGTPVPVGATIPARTAGTDTEDCWDVITIDVVTNAINCTRYGAGSDRTAN